MKKYLFTSLVLMGLFTASAQADNCNIEFNGDFRFDAKGINIARDEQTFFISPEHRLYHNDIEVPLNQNQQRRVSQYYQEVEFLVPEAVNMGMEAAELAINGVSMAFSGLLGEEEGSEIRDSLASIKARLSQQLYDDQNHVQFTTSNAQADGFAFDALTDEFEAEVERLAEAAMGKILIALGKDMLFSGGDSKEFEARMEQFAEQIEAEMERQSAAIEVRADALCARVQRLHQLDTQLADAIPALQGAPMLDIRVQKEGTAGLK